MSTPAAGYDANKRPRTGADKKLVSFDGRLLIVGFGSIGQGVLPLILRHIDLSPKQVHIITAAECGKEEAEELGVSFRVQPLTKSNYRQLLDELLEPGDFLLNLSVDVSTVALVEYCQNKNVLYLDTCIEPWAGGYVDTSLSPSLRSNYALREAALSLRSNAPASAPTAVLTHGANPGMVSHFVKQALLDLAAELGHPLKSEPTCRAEWARLAQALDVKVIHIAERDTQVSATKPKRVNEFVNTWSIDGFVGEGCQPAELGWGSHERHFPSDGSLHEFGGGAAIYLNRPGISTRVRSWTPLEGPYHGFLVTHGESISIADYLTVKSQCDQCAEYRPTVHYTYHPCNDAILSLHELAGKNFQMQGNKRLLMEEISHGMDELGVLLMGHRKNCYWYGSRLSIEEARLLAPYQNATGLQVTASVLAAVIWAIENPSRGVVEPDEMDFRRVLQIAEPYLGDVLGVFGEWTPLKDRGSLFPEDVDETDPWQFKNFRVA